MRILLDECQPRKLQRLLPGHACQTVAAAGFSGKSNGELLQLAGEAGFDVFLTMDKGIPHQQDSARRGIAVIVMRARSNKVESLAPHIPKLLATLRSAAPGRFIVLD